MPPLEGTLCTDVGSDLIFPVAQLAGIDFLRAVRWLRIVYWLKGVA